MKNKYLLLPLLMLFSVSAWAMEPFVVKDIRVEGIQRTEAGTVFSYLPVKVGEKLDDARAAAAIKALYATGFFKDVRLEVENGVLIVMVQERPAIAKMEFIGIKEFPVEQLKESLKQINLAEGRIFDKSKLDLAEQEMKRQYLSRGKYNVEIKITTTPLERNRVALNFNVNEGEVAKIRQINIVGTQAFKESKLLDMFVLTSSGWMTWYSKNDQYSKQKLSADLETLRSHYMNNGYLEFAIDSTQISITPDKKDIYITINITEGARYTISDIKLAGTLLLPEEELRKLIKVKPGDTFSRERLTESTKLIGDRLGNEGYAFANVNAVPELDKDKQQATFTFFLDPGRRVYIRRINVVGNNKTRDEVVRREMRQMEGGWYATEKVTRSRERVDRLGYFSEVNVETPAVVGTTDQVDMVVSVTEKPTGNLMAGAGYSSSDGLVMSGSVSQSNIFGSGNFLSTQVNTSKVNRTFAVSFTDPYYTPDGVSRGFDLYLRTVNAANSSASNYSTRAIGGALRFGVPMTETDTVGFGLAVDHTTLVVYDDSPQSFKDDVTNNGASRNTLIGSAGWGRDNRDSLTYPTKGTKQNAQAEVGLPGGNTKYYKLTYQHQWLTPLTREYSLMLNGDVGVAGGYGGKDLPFNKVFYGGGVTSVRGYTANSIGPKDIYGNALGGTKRIIGNAEFLFPIPGLKNDKSTRMSAFFDAGAVMGNGEKVNMSNFRYSTGVALGWSSPMGPLKFSFAKPINNKEGDKLERLQFTMGSTF